jgi:trans-aconitate methyltransferase
MDLVESASHTTHVHERHPWELARVEVAKQVLADLDLRPGDMVLDVGCGDSFMAQAIAALYPDVTFCGIDTALDEHRVAAFTRTLEIHNLRLFRTLEHATAAAGGRRAAIVFLMDVIEHIQDDVAFLRALQSSPLVGAGTRYVVSVPAFTCLFSSHDVFLGHYRRYSNTTLKRHLESAGLESQLLCYFFTSLLAPRYAQVLIEKVFGAKPRQTTQAAAWRGHRILQSAIRTILEWDFYISRALYRHSGITLPGLSNLAVCRSQRK